MIGTIVNSLAIAIGGLIGILLKKWIKEEYSSRVLKVIGLSVLAISIVGIVKAMITINYDLSLSTHFELLIIILIATGTLIGEVLKIDDGLNKLGLKIEQKLIKNSKEEGTFAKGFISASLVACVGAMALVGSINDALGDPSMLYIKSVIDFVTMMIFASSMGWGVVFSSITVFVYQGIITLLGFALGNFLPQEFILAFSALGYTMIMAIAFNFVTDSKIKVANMLPAVLLLIIYFIIKSYFL